MLEAVKLPAIITNIDFKTMCRTPIGNETPLHLCLQLDPVEGIDNAKAFKILSTPGKVPYSGTAEEVINLKYTEHCSGMVFKGDINSMGEFKQGSQGFFTKMELNDIGKDGTARHGTCIHIIETDAFTQSLRTDWAAGLISHQAWTRSSRGTASCWPAARTCSTACSTSIR